MLVLTLQTKQLDLQLNTYINDESTIFKTYTPQSQITDDGYELNFHIFTNEYSVGDIITEFELTTNSSKHRWETNEGIVWLIDGVESDSLFTDNMTTTFSDTGVHTVEAVFVGNDALEMTTTGKQSIHIEQPESDDSGSLDNDGTWEKLITVLYETNSPRLCLRNLMIYGLELMGEDREKNGVIRLDEYI